MYSKVTITDSWRRFSQASGLFFGRERHIWLRIFLRGGQELLTVDNILFAAAAFLFGRANILGELASFGLVFWALVARYNPKKSKLTAAMAIGGRATVFSGWAFFSLPISIVALGLLEKGIVKIFRKELPPFVLVPVALLVSYIPLILYTYLTVYEIVMLILEVLVALLVSILLTPVANVLDKPRLEIKQEEMIGALLFFLLLLLGLGNFVIGGFVSVQNIVSKFFLITGAFLFGPGWGSAVGLLMGMVVSINDPQIVFLISSFTAAGFLGGFLRQFNRVGSVFGYLLASQLFSLYMAPVNSLFLFLREDLMVSLIFLLIPIWLVEKLKYYHQPFLFLESGVREEELRKSAAQRIVDFAKIFQDLSQTFKYNTSLVDTATQRDISPLLVSLAKRMCRSCPVWKRCWEKEFNSHYRQIFQLFVQAEAGKKIKKGNIPNDLKKRCHRTFDLVNQINDLLDMYKVNRHWQKKVSEGRNLVSAQLKGISQVMHDLAQEIKLATEVNGKERPFSMNSNMFSVEIGIAQHPRHEEGISGDSYSFVQLKGGQQAVILSDGMGKGYRAYHESSATVNLIESLLKTGFKKELVLHTVNSLLQLRSLDEIFATLDMAFFDLTEGEVEFLKIGAVPSYLKRNNEVKEYGTVSLPLGILQDIDPGTTKVRLEDRDLLVMVSDGIIDFKSSNRRDWLKDVLNTIKHSHPQIVADYLLEEVRENNSSLEDDATIIVCRVNRLRYKFNSFV